MVGLLEVIGTTTFANLLSSLTMSYISSEDRSIDAPKEIIQTDLHANIEVAYNKCIKTKTILNDSPVDFLSVYTDQSFQIEDKVYDQYNLVELISDNGTSICITGTGGGGKSMFVRYLWLSLFENPKGKIPFFLELRQLNNLNHGKLEDFIFHSIIKTGSSISQGSFKNAMKNGEFVLLLDGFDELNVELREKFEDQIIELKENNPQLTIIVTSRPDDRFSGWHQFHSAKVQPLKKNQVIDLIKKVTFDEYAKKSLLKKIRNGMYESHSSFLSNPLLASMMLVTVSYNPDIPIRMFSFYEQAFEALYYRHDLTKSGYKRKLYCPIEKHDLIRILSYFCLTTYYQQAFEFNEFQLQEYCEKAIGIENYKLETTDFIKDAIESVCLLKKEGIEYSFTHRTFQEYFAALCLSRVAGNNLEKFFSNFAKRHTDQVIGMIYDMNPFLFREKYVNPIHEKYKRLFKINDPHKAVIQYMKDTKGQFVIRPDSKEDKLRKQKKKTAKQNSFLISYQSTGELTDFSLNIRRLANGNDVQGKKEIKKSWADIDRRRTIDNSFAHSIYSAHNELRDEILTIRLYRSRFSFFLSNTNITTDELLSSFLKTPMYEFLFNQSNHVRAFVSDEMEIFNSVSNKLDDLI